MNPNYTEFKFPQIKAHPWTKVSQQVQEPFSFLLYKIHVMSDRPPSVLVTPPQHTLLHPASPPSSPRSQLLVRLVSAASRFFFCCAHPGRRCGMPWNFTLLSSSCFSELSFSLSVLAALAPFHAALRMHVWMFSYCWWWVVAKCCWKCEYCSTLCRRRLRFPSDH